jgi:diguanylate cyclase (GGDEF)-like protein
VVRLGFSDAGQAHVHAGVQRSSGSLAIRPDWYFRATVSRRTVAQRTPMATQDPAAEGAAAGVVMDAGRGTTEPPSREARVAGRWTVALRVWSFTALLAGLAALLFFGFLVNQPVPHPPLGVPWPVLALAFFAAELKVVDVHFRREKHSFTLSEIPAVMGFFLLPPGEYFVAMLLGAGAALVLVDQRPIKLAFNLAGFAFVWAAAMSVFYMLGGDGAAPALQEWVAAFAATAVGAVLSSVTIATVISLSGGAPQFQKLPEMIQFGELVAVANTSLALLAVSALWLQPTLLFLLVVPLVTVFLAYRAYTSEREKHERLELLYQSSRILQHSPELDSALAALVRHAREMFRAERAEIVLWPQDGGPEGLLTGAYQDAAARTMDPVAMHAVNPLHDRAAQSRRAFLHMGSIHDTGGVRHAMVAPLLGESRLIGSMLIVNRLTEGTTFVEEDLRLLETLANQAAVALENGQLEQSLAELSRLKEELRYQAYHDPLTGLANRSLFLERVEEAIASMGSTIDSRGGAEAGLPAVLFLDLDNFKDVNDSLGHAAGDRLLLAVADRVRSCIRTGDLAARLGGDEFAILLRDDPRLGNGLTVATRILGAFAASFPVEGQDLRITASIGIAASQAGEHADDLLRNADVAMYTAKHSGKHRFSVFEPGMHAAIVARHALSNELARGITVGEIEVFYQPIVSLATGQAYGAEALARWRHPTRGILKPDDFIPLAEESGAILELGRAVLFESCRQAATWRSATGAPLAVTVNLSAAQLAREDFVTELVDILRATGLPASRLALEMTETAMFHDTNATVQQLAAVRALGVRVAIDDFGTGYSSLGYLRRFPVDILKIAREFIAPAGAGPDGWAFAHAIVALGQTLGLRIVAEGIEEPSQLAQLQVLGCELGQGFLFAKPMPADRIAAVLRAPARLPGAPEATGAGSAAPAVDGLARRPISGRRTATVGGHG